MGIQIGAYLQYVSTQDSNRYTQGRRYRVSYHVCEEEEAQAALSKLKGRAKKKYLENLKAKYELIAEVRTPD